MVRQERLASVLSDFARTMLTDFQVQGILDHLVERIVDVMGVSAAGVTLISPGLAPRYIAASSDLALHNERLQSELRQGPCVTAYVTGEAVAVPDLTQDVLFSEFSRRAQESGLAAVFAFPLRHGGARLGALDLYRDTVGPLDPEDVAAAQTLADVAAAYLLNAEARGLATAMADRFRESSLHDALTGLPNRTLLQQCMEHAARRAARSHGLVAILFIDLDRFKQVNDQYGHSVGDELLAAVAARLSTLVRPADTLARTSGDEFVILCEDVADLADVEHLAARIVDGFTEPFLAGGLLVPMKASVGVAYRGPGEAITTQLLLDADAAMYQAKRRGGDRHCVLDVEEQQQTRQYEDLGLTFRRALDREEFSLAYQPIVRASDGLVVGVEALLRWKGAGQDLVPPSTTLLLAAQTGLVTNLGEWVLERACRDRKRWFSDHPDVNLDLSVNVSPRQVLSPGFPETVKAVLDLTGLDPAVLILELTEEVFLDHDDNRASRVLGALKDLGVQIALDDFGTGYSSLNYLRQFPVDIVKVDQRFVADLGHDPAAAAIVSAVTNLAHILGIRVTAEGVETAEQRAEVVRLGCEFAQGFYFARPQNGATIATELTGGGNLRLPKEHSTAG